MSARTWAVVTRRRYGWEVIIHERPHSVPDWMSFETARFWRCTYRRAERDARRHLRRIAHVPESRVIRA